MPDLLLLQDFGNIPNDSVIYGLNERVGKGKPVKSGKSCNL